VCGAGIFLLADGPSHWTPQISEAVKEVALPTQAKVDKVNELKEKLERCSIAVTTSYTNIRVNEMTELRRRTREAGMEFLVIKNTLMSLAADAAQRPQFKDIMQGPTAVAFGYDDPISVAKTLHDYIRTTRSALTIQGAVMGSGPALPSGEVERLATLPPKDQMVAQLLAQLQSPVYRLLNVLNGPLWNLGGLLQARIRQLEAGEASG
jgi:large subunit ribosomal protein L10